MGMILRIHWNGGLFFPPLVWQLQCWSWPCLFFAASADCQVPTKTAAVCRCTKTSETLSFHGYRLRKGYTKTLDLHRFTIILSPFLSVQLGSTFIFSSSPFVGYMMLYVPYNIAINLAIHHLHCVLVNRAPKNFIREVDPNHRIPTSTLQDIATKFLVESASSPPVAVDCFPWPSHRRPSGAPSCVWNPPGSTKPAFLGSFGSVSKPCTPGEHQNSW